MPPGGVSLDELQAARAEIDEIDAQMAALFCRRMEAVKQVAAYKRKHGMVVLDAAREEEVVRKSSARLGDQKEEYGAYYEDFVRYLMSLSRAMQRRLLGSDTVAYQGVEGAFSHIALERLFPHSAQKSCETFAGVVKAVENGDAVYGVLPFENSYAGDVSEVLDLCYAHPGICVWDMYDLPVVQNLLGIKGALLSDVRQVLSHPQALWQCDAYLKNLGVQTREAKNTAAAAKEVAEQNDPALAAIASYETAGLYGLEVLAPHINESRTNTTRFIVIGRECRAAGNRFNLLFTVDHKAGALARVMRIIGENGFNMECIKSRPMKDCPWEYYFYAELVGDIAAAGTQTLMHELEAVCRTVRLLGVYTRKEVAYERYTEERKPTHEIDHAAARGQL